MFNFDEIGYIRLYIGIILFRTPCVGPKP